jgi:hypothetical protein
MRFLRLPIAVLTLVMLAVPRPAHAWFAFLDYLSGPGRFYGEKFDFRVKCFGQKSGLADVERDLVGAALETLTASQDPDLQSPVSPQGLASPASTAALLRARKPLADMVKQLESLNKLLHFLEPSEIAEIQKEIDKLDAQAFITFAAAFKPRDEVTKARLRLSGNPVYATLQKVEAQLDKAQKGLVSMASTGVFVSFCSPEIIRKYSIELGATLQQATSDPNYAQSYPIHLNTLTAAVSYRFTDAIDLRAGLGGYQFSSRGFETFYGLTIEPGVDLHVPTGWVNNGGLKMMVAPITARLGLVWFAGGFDTGPQFAAIPDKDRHISGWEATPSLTIYYDLAPYLRRRTRLF